MYSLLIAVIYLAFISLGLPDSLLGAAWPVIYKEIDVPVSYAGIITMIIAAGTVASSLLSDRLTKKFGAGLVTAVSVLVTATALFGFSSANSFLTLCMFALPYGLGAGAIDAALNNYVALHYSSRHMNWLHCFWGVGATISPYIMNYCLLQNAYDGWNTGYRTISVIQLIITALLFISLPFWKKRQKPKTQEILTNGKIRESENPTGLFKVIKIKGVVYVLFAFFAYCAFESTCGLWASSYLVLVKGIDSETAAGFASLFFLGITAGRFLCGFISNKIGGKNMIRAGTATIGAGLASLIFPNLPDTAVLAGLVIIGLGCAPIYPSVIHQTPENFGKENSQAIIGTQMASAYIGTTFMPPLFGLIFERLSIGLFPFYILIFAVLMTAGIEILNIKQKEKICND